MFKKGDYIVVLRDQVEDTHYIKFAYCYNQREDLIYLAVEKDNIGEPRVSSGIKFSRKKLWRYAVQDEITTYNSIGKPYKVSQPIRITTDTLLDALDELEIKYGKL